MTTTTESKTKAMYFRINESLLNSIKQLAKEKNIKVSSLIRDVLEKSIEKNK